jgi:hypothetical protein
MKTKLVNSIAVQALVGLTGLALLAGCEPSGTENSPSTGIKPAAPAPSEPAVVIRKPDAPPPSPPVTNQPGADQPGTNQPSTNTPAPNSPEKANTPP